MKAILVIDIDEKYLGKEISLIKFTDDNAIYCSEELKPLPQKIKVNVESVQDIIHTEFQMVDVIQDRIIGELKVHTDNLFALGYNKCLDDILGIKNEINR